MKLFDVILKLIRTFALVESEDYTILKNDVQGWTDSASEDSEDKLQVLYAKMHKGVMLRLAMPFLYFVLLKWVKGLNKDDEEELF